MFIHHDGSFMIRFRVDSDVYYSDTDRAPHTSASFGAREVRWIDCRWQGGG